MFLDICLPDTSGLDLLTRLRELKPRAPVVILMTAYESTRDAVLAMKRGAYDYLGKPFNIDAVCLLVKRALDHTRRTDGTAGLPATDAHGPWLGSACDRIIGASAAMSGVLDVIRRLPAGSASNVLIEGETGTGKELLAHAIHETSERGTAPFVAIGCGAIPHGLMEAELFGYDKGAFTGALREGKRGAFERAGAGAIFLDEVAELDLGLQVKLLRVLEAREFSRVGGLSEIPLRAQVIAATNRDLGREVDAGRFRADLYFRLNVLRVKLPPLRERGGDVMLLARAFMRDFNSRFGKGFKAISSHAQKLLESYPWPGNVRELRNTIERVVLIEDDVETGPTILAEHLSDFAELSRDASLPAPPAAAPVAGRPTFTTDSDAMAYGGRDGRKRSIVTALERTGGNVVKAARLLGLKRGALRYRMDKYGVAREWPYVSDVPDAPGPVGSTTWSGRRGPGGSGGGEVPHWRQARGRSSRSLLNSEA